MNTEWEVVIGLEVHVELATKSKIFCACTTEFLTDKCLLMPLWPALR